MLQQVKKTLGIGVPPKTRQYQGRQYEHCYRFTDLKTGLMYDWSADDQDTAEHCLRMSKHLGERKLDCKQVY
jgi:hypothetical protein